MKKILYLIISLPLLLASCNDWLTVIPKTDVVLENMLSSDEGVQQALTGIYIRMRYLYHPEGIMGGGGGGALENAANSWTRPGGVGEDTREYAYMTHNWNHAQIETSNNSLFEDLFKIVNNLNPIINHIDDYRAKLRRETYSIAKGEALALRAYIMFDIMRIWGPSPASVDPTRKYIPYPTENTLESYPYRTWEQIWEQLQKDITEAEELMADFDPIIPANPSVSRFEDREYYMNYYAALGLHARMAMWFGEEPMALEYARKIMEITGTTDTDVFRFATNADYVSWSDGTFRTEHLAGISSTYVYDSGSSMWRPGGPYLYHTVPEGNLRDILFDGNADDLRLRYQWLYNAGQPMMGIPAYYTLRKYNSFTTLNSGNGRFPLIRVPEMYFIVMECSDDLQEINAAYEEFCESRNIAYLPFADIQEIDDVIQHMYIAEFHSEGQNYFTYKRFGAATQLWAPDGVSFTPDSYVWPIPNKEFDYEQ